MKEAGETLLATFRGIHLNIFKRQVLMTCNMKHNNSEIPERR